MKKEKGIVGCVTCGTSLGCLLPMALGFGLILIFAISNYFDESYYWEDADVWIVVVLALIVIPSFFLGLIQAVIGLWSLAGFFDQDVSLDELNLLKPIPPVGGEGIVNTTAREEDST